MIAVIGANRHRRYTRTLTCSGACRREDTDEQRSPDHRDCHCPGSGVHPGRTGFVYVDIDERADELRMAIDAIREGAQVRQAAARKASR